MSCPAISTSRGRLDLADQRPDQGRLAATGWPDHEGELAAIERERDPLDAQVASRIDNGRVAKLDDRRTPAGGANRHGAPRRAVAGEDSVQRAGAVGRLF